MGRRTEAIGQFEQSLQIDPHNADTHFNLGYILQQTGQLSEAMEQYQEALKIKPDFATARDNLAKLQALQKTPPAKN
jgi:Flp pilus assembly protein TadD